MVVYISHFVLKSTHTTDGIPVRAVHHWIKSTQHNTNSKHKHEQRSFKMSSPYNHIHIEMANGGNMCHLLFIFWKKVANIYMQ